MESFVTPQPCQLKTDDLISRLGMQAGEPPAERGLFRHLPFHRALPVALTLAAVGAFTVVTLVIGIRPGLSSILSTWIFQFKVAAMTLMSCGALLLVRNASIPGLAARPVIAMTPALLFILVGAVFDRSGFPLLGAHALSVPICVGAIILASLPALAVMLAAMRLGVPTRPGWAGGMAGTLAGSLGALAYTLACINDGAGFVALWYLLAIVIVAAIGATAGRRVLAW